MSGGFRSNKLYVPLITILGSAGLFFVYSFFYVSWQRNYANERAFRLLSVVGDQLAKRFENLTSVLAAALVSSPDKSAPNAHHRDPFQYLKEVPGYKDQISVIKAKSCPESWKREGNLTLRLNNPGTFSLQAAFQPTGLSASNLDCFILADVKPALDLRERFHNLTADYFDDILIATSAGDVLFESNVSGLRITNLNVLVASQADNRQARQEGPAGEGKSKTSGSFQDASQFSNVREVKLAGSVYNLYVQPVPVQITAGAKDNAKDKEYLKILVCGLWRTDRQQSEVVSIPYSTLIWGVLAVLAVFGMTWPLLKVAYMSPAERLKRIHVFMLLSSGLFVTTILTVIVLNCAYTVRADEESQEQLGALAKRIDDNVRTELSRALTLMNALEIEAGDNPARALLRKATRENWTSARILENPFFDKLTPISYPYFDNVFWTDDKGRQVYKLTVRGEATPQTPVEDYLFFQCVRDRQHLKELGNLTLPNGSEISAETRGTPFRFEPQYSKNTGEFFAVIAKPSKRGSLPVYFEHMTAQVLVTRFLSLVGPVVPAGFGYALVDHDGLVQFHSSPGRNQIENFFKESREDPAVKALVTNGTSDYVNVDYNGKRQLMLVRPLEYLADPAPTLIVFRDTNYFNTINVACMLVFVLLAGLFSLPFLAGLATYIVRSGAYPLERLWPCENASATYVEIVLANVCLAAAFVIRFPAMEMAEILRALATIAAATAFFAIAGSKWAGAGSCRHPSSAARARSLIGRAVVLLAIVIVAWWSWALVAAAYVAFFVPAVSRRLDGFAQSVHRVKVFYLAAVFSLLTVLVVLPCFGLFKISYHAVNRLALETAQRERLDLLSHRARTIRECFAALDGRSNEPGRAIGGALYSILRQRMGEGLDRYDDAVFWPADVDGAEVSGLGITRLEKGIAWATGWFPTNRLGAQLRATAMADAHNGGLLWKRGRSGDDEVLELIEDFQGTVPEGRLRGVYPMWQLPVQAAILMALLVPVLIAWLSYMIRKVFLTGLTKVPPLKDWVPGEVKSNLTIIGHPKSGRSTWAGRLDGKDTVDLAQVIASGHWTLPDFRNPTVVVDNFEFDMDNPATCLKKLELLEDLVYLRNKRVIVLSAVDPMFYLEASSPEIVTLPGGEPPAQILDRWASVLSSFVKWTMKNDIEAYLASIARKRTPCPRELVALINEECKYTAWLRKLGFSILDGRCKQATVSKGEVVEDLLDRADAYYHVLWSTCTKDERLVLFQLARDGWANPKNERAIQQLERRSLVRRSPGLRIMNESFCRFVRTAQLPGEVEKWQEDEQHSTWSALKLGLTTASLMAGAWLLYTQRDVFQMGVGYVAAMGTASAAVLSLVRSITRPKAGSSADTAGSR
jgi:hypothetical protein